MDELPIEHRGGYLEKWDRNFFFNDWLGDIVVAEVSTVSSKRSVFFSAIWYRLNDFNS